jgi:hypothetical protein
LLLEFPLFNLEWWWTTLMNRHLFIAYYQIDFTVTPHFEIAQRGFVGVFILLPWIQVLLV